MIRSLLLSLALLFPLPAYAASFISVRELQYEWNYTFSIKRSLFSKSETVEVTEFDCTVPGTWTKDHKPIYPPKDRCFETEAEARIAAQKKADEFEKHMKDM